ncbi:hypothetical protein [Sphingobium sp. C100]|uniref:hypothetical protein n=1 Tax=Sphingobium sp. C100 TaxID=1207055 RepID=UPI0012685234|nr:hypothetical protein [Sphingobium sp. C100]
MRILILGLAAASMPVSAAEQYDLDCEGQKTEQEGANPTAEAVNLSIDLKSMQYCYRPCSKVLPIDEVFADRIILRSYNHIERGVIISFHAQVNRKTGEYSYIVDQRAPSFKKSVTVALCSLKPFSGFPAVKF